MKDQEKDLLESLIELALEDAPEIGALLDGIIDLVWDDDQQDMSTNFQSLLTELQSYVDQEIVNNAIADLKSKIKGFTQNMAQYAQSTESSERQGYMISMITQANELKEELIDVADNPNCIQFIPLSSSFLPLHLAILKEQYLYGAEIYGDDKDQDAWAEQLSGAVQDYLDYMTGNYAALKKWRSDQVKTTTNIKTLIPSVKYEITSKVLDTVSGKSVTFVGIRSSEENKLFTPYAQSIHSLVQSQWELYVNDQLIPYYWITSFQPDNVRAYQKVFQVPMSALNQLAIGPINIMTFCIAAPDLFFGKNNPRQLSFGTLVEYPPNAPETNDANDNLDAISSIQLFKNDENEFIGMQVGYTDFIGSVIGSASTNSIDDTFAPAQLVEMQVAFMQPDNDANQDLEVDNPQVSDLGFLLSDGNSFNPIGEAINVLRVTAPSLYYPFLINGARTDDDKISQLSIGFAPRPNPQ